MSATTKTGGSAFDPKDRHVYFLASDIGRLLFAIDYHPYALVAINQMNTAGQVEIVRGWINRGVRVLIDSGVFNLAAEHAKKHNLTISEAINLDPEEIDGYGALFDRYVSIVGEIGADAWGYIEIDQGGRENKIKTRAKLEEMGLRPIPVYHPFGDGWDYFDYLAQRYDRLAMGNMVGTPASQRKRLIATTWERHRAYPDLWLHLLGVTPNQWTNALPMDSGDSSAWLAAVKWSGVKPRCDGSTLGTLPRDFQYVLGSDPNSKIGSRRGTITAAVEAHFQQVNWQKHIQGWRELGMMPAYPHIGDPK